MGIFERILVRMENFGYKAANFTHKVAVTTVAVGSLYGFYALMRDYRAYFKLRKTDEYAEHIKKRHELMRTLIEARDKKESD